MDHSHVALIIEQNRQTHAKIDALVKTFAEHAEKDETFYATVAKHDRLVTTGWAMTKWGAGLGIPALLAWLGLKQ